MLLTFARYSLGMFGACVGLYVLDSKVAKYLKAADIGSRDTEWTSHISNENARRPWPVAG